MTPTQFRRFAVHAFGAVALSAMTLLAACGSSSTTTGTSATATTVPPTNTPPSQIACSVKATDLSTGTIGAQATATKDAGVSGNISISGSTALQPLFAAAGKEFDTANNTVTTVGGGGSGQGLKDAESGASAIGMSDFFVQERSAADQASFKDLVDHKVAAVVFTLVVSQDIATGSKPVTNLTSAQIKGIYDGSISNWSAVGGPDEPITVFIRAATSGTRFTFLKYVIKDTGFAETSTAVTANATSDVQAKVAATPGSIGYVTTQFITNSAATSVLYPVCIDGFGASAANVNSGKYNFWSFEHAYTKGDATGTAKAFLTYVTGTAFQGADVPGQVYLNTSTLSSTAVSSHTPAGA